MEEAVRIVERLGGTVTVLTLGPPEAAEQLRDALAVGANAAILLQTDGREWGPAITAEAIASVAERHADDSGWPYELLLFGNEAADSGDSQVPVRVGHLLGRPCVTAIKRLEVEASGARASREYRGVTETFDLSLPAVVSVKEGINLPRYPSLPGRMRATRAKIDVIEPAWREEGVHLDRLRLPATDRRRAAVIGHGVHAVPALVDLLESLGTLS
jgi:electron transfer flavoprotein beta subunit